MGRIICCLLTTTVLLSGCNITNKFAFKPKKTSPEMAEASADKEASRKKTDPVEVYLAHAAWNEQKGDYSVAHDDYVKVLKKRPREVRAILGLARIDQAYGREAEADLHMKKAFKLQPKDKKVLMAIGQIHFARQDWPKAIEKMDAAHNIDPYDKVNTYYLAVAEARAGEIPLALEHFTGSVGEAIAHYNLGVILGEQGRAAEAESHLMQALKLNPGFKQAEVSLSALRAATPKDVQPASFDDRSR